MSHRWQPQVAPVSAVCVSYVTVACILPSLAFPEKYLYVVTTCRCLACVSDCLTMLVVFVIVVIVVAVAIVVVAVAIVVAAVVAAFFSIIFPTANSLVSVFVKGLGLF